MAFAGPPVPDLAWRDYERGTSLASDLLRLASGGLFTVGGIRRQMEKESQSREDRLAERSTLADQFGERLALDRDRLAQDDLQHRETLAARRSDDDTEYEVDPATRTFTPVAQRSTTLPDLRRTGAEVARRGFPPIEEWSARHCPT